MPIVTIIAKDTITISASECVTSAIREQLQFLQIEFNNPASTLTVVDNDGDEIDILNVIACVSHAQ